MKSRAAENSDKAAEAPCELFRNAKPESGIEVAEARDSWVELRTARCLK